MTGADFRSITQSLGLKQYEIADQMEVGTDTIRARYKEDRLIGLWEHAVIGLVASHQLPMLISLVNTKTNKSKPKTPLTLERVAKSLGLSQIGVAQVLEVDPDTVRVRYREKKLSGVWRMALIGLTMKHHITPVAAAAEIFGI